MTIVPELRLSKIPQPRLRSKSRTWRNPSLLIVAIGHRPLNWLKSIRGRTIGGVRSWRGRRIGWWVGRSIGSGPSWEMFGFCWSWLSKFFFDWDCCIKCIRWLFFVCLLSVLFSSSYILPPFLYENVVCTYRVVVRTNVRRSSICQHIPIKAKRQKGAQDDLFLTQFSTDTRRWIGKLFFVQKYPNWCFSRCLCSVMLFFGEFSKTFGGVSRCHWLLATGQKLMERRRLYVYKLDYP